MRVRFRVRVRVRVRGKVRVRVRGRGKVKVRGRGRGRGRGRVRAPRELEPLLGPGARAVASRGAPPLVPAPGGVPLVAAHHGGRARGCDRGPSAGQRSSARQLQPP